MRQRAAFSPRPRENGIPHPREEVFVTLKLFRSGLGRNLLQGGEEGKKSNDGFPGIHSIFVQVPQHYFLFQGTRRSPLNPQTVCPRSSLDVLVDNAPRCVATIRCPSLLAGLRSTACCDSEFPKYYEQRLPSLPILASLLRLSGDRDSPAASPRSQEGTASPFESQQRPRGGRRSDPGRGMVGPERPSPTPRTVNSNTAQTEKS